MDFSVISRAGLTQQQFGQLVGVNRITVNTWIGGRYSPNNRLRPRVLKALQLLADAVKAGTLPIDDSHRERAVQRQLDRLSRALRHAG